MTRETTIFLLMGIVQLGLLTQPAAAKKMAVTVLAVEGEVELMRGGDTGQTSFLQGGETIQEEDRIYTGMDSRVKLKFADNSVVLVQELTDMKVAAFRSKGDAIQTRLWVRAGEVTAQVDKSDIIESDFQIRTPTATAGVRGTTFTCFNATPGSPTLQGTNNGTVNLASRRSGNNSNVGRGENASADRHGRTRNPRQTRHHGSRSDGTANGKSEDEDNALDETEFNTPFAPGLLNTAGINTQGEELASTNSLAQGGGTDAMVTNLIQNGGFTDGLGAGSFWSTFGNTGVGTSGNLASGSTGLALPTPGSDGNFAAIQSLSGTSGIYQDFNIPSAGIYTFNVDYNLIVTGDWSGNFDVAINDSAHQTLLNTSIAGTGNTVGPVNFLTSTNIPGITFPHVMGSQTNVSHFTRGFQADAAGPATISIDISGFGSTGASGTVLIDNVSVNPGGVLENPI